MENEPKQNSRKKGIFKLGDKVAAKSRGPFKSLPSALRKKRSDSASKNDTDSPLAQDNQVDDVMAKYQEWGSFLNDCDHFYNFRSRYRL